MKFLQSIDQNKPLLLCLAGNLCSPKLFDKIKVPEFMQKVYLDYLVGPGPWDMNSLGYNLIDMVKHLEGLPIILASYSAGGVLAISAVAKEPELFAGLVLSNTGPCSIGHGNQSFVQELEDNFDNEQYMRKFLSSCFYRPIDGEMEDELLAYARTISKEAGCEVSSSLRQVDYRENLKNYKNPVAIIHGQFDTRRKLNSVTMLKTSLPQAEITFLKTGHTPMWEDPVGYQEALNKLIKKAAEKMVLCQMLG